MESVCQRGGPERLLASADEPACGSHWAEGLRFAGAAAAAAGLVFGGHVRLMATNREAMTMSSHAHRTEWQLDTPPGKPLVYVLVIGRDARLGKSDGSEMLRFLVSASDVTATKSHTVSIVCQHAQVISGEPGQWGP